MDWDNARVIKQENNRYHCWIKEAIEIRKRTPGTMNRDEGAYMFSHTWSGVLGGGGLTAGGVTYGSPVKKTDRLITPPKHQLIRNASHQGV